MVRTTLHWKNREEIEKEEEIERLREKSKKLERKGILKDREEVLIETLGLYLDTQSIYPAWRQGQLYVTNQRVFSIDSNQELLFEVGFEKIIGLEIPEKKHFAIAKNKGLFIVPKTDVVVKLYIKQNEKVKSLIKKAMEEKGFLLEDCSRIMKSFGKFPKTNFDLIKSNKSKPTNLSNPDTKFVPKGFIPKGNFQPRGSFVPGCFEPKGSFEPKGFTPVDDYEPSNTYKPRGYTPKSSFIPKNTFEPKGYAPKGSFQPQGYRPADSFKPSGYTPRGNYVPSSSYTPSGYVPHATPYGSKGFGDNIALGIFQKFVPKVHTPKGDKILPSSSLFYSYRCRTYFIPNLEVPINFEPRRHIPTNQKIKVKNLVKLKNFKPKKYTITNTWIKEIAEEERELDLVKEELARKVRRIKQLEKEEFADKKQERNMWIKDIMQEEREINNVKKEMVQQLQEINSKNKAELRSKKQETTMWIKGIMEKEREINQVKKELVQQLQKT